MDATTNDILFYFSKSADKAPGKGKNEHVSNAADYAELSLVPHWRKILSNFYVAPFVWNQHTWASAEHAFQGYKIGLVDAEKGYWFTLDSGHAIGQGDGLVARKHRKLVWLDDAHLQAWDEMKSTVLEDILYAKFSQVEEARAALLATHHAGLLHGARGPALRQYELERVRERLQ
jgi:predicted NAD-dependent protein-ADP-ribosyltransferase YbiA (DUF1768 family)